MGIDASLWRGTTLKTHLLVGIHIFSDAPALSITILPDSTVWMAAMLTPVDEYPRPAITLSTSIRRFVSVTPFVALLSESYTVILSCLPLTPPAVLTASTAISRPRFSGPPILDIMPVRSKTAPTGYGAAFCARLSPVASSIQPNIATEMIKHFPMLCFFIFLYRVPTCHSEPRPQRSIWRRGRCGYQAQS